MSSSQTATKPFYRTLICVTFVVLVTNGLMACNDTRSSAANVGLCPQPRNTEYAPASIASRMNPLPVTSANMSAGKELFNGAASAVSCSTCHGNTGAGNGPLASQFQPAPRNFTCIQTMQTLTDGQIFWVIQNGSVGTSIPAFNKLYNKQIWQLVMYVRSLATAR